MRCESSYCKIPLYLWNQPYIYIYIYIYIYLCVCVCVFDKRGNKYPQPTHTIFCWPMLQPPQKKNPTVWLTKTFPKWWLKRQACFQSQSIIIIIIIITNQMHQQYLTITLRVIAFRHIVGMLVSLSLLLLYSQLFSNEELIHWYKIWINCQKDTSLKWTW